MSELLAERYELGRVIGAGGMAKVHLATDRFLDRPVAVKVLDDVAARSADPAARERFLNEARSAAGFTHHNAVSVFDAGQDDGVLYIVMEYVAGETLATRIAERTILPIGESVSFAIQILEALGAMHERGLLHRDVKPANVLLTDAGRVKLTDFGIAKRLDEIDEALTSAGTVIGTPRYLSPEQAVGGELGPTTDIYLVGIVLHEMLTGERPPSALMGVPSQRPDPRRLRADLPAPLAEVVARSLDYLPERRWPDASSMVAALRSATDGESSPEPAPPVGQPSAPGDSGTRAMPAPTPDTADRTQVVATDGTADTPPHHDPQRPDVDRVGDHAEGSTRAWSMWIPIAAVVLLIALVGYGLVSNGSGSGDGEGDDAPSELTGDDFLTTLRADPGQFGDRGPDVLERLEAVLATEDEAERAAAREALEVDIFVWVTDGELDTSVGEQVASVLDG